jgi:predicted dehydrogenase
MNRVVSRRLVLQMGVAASTLSLLPGAHAVSANGKLRTAHIGVGGMGNSDLRAISSHAKVEVAALCDVDSNTLSKAQAGFPNAKVFKDYREMLSQLGNTIDAVVVSTPDHTHAPAAMSALNLGKPVYCQKPLTHEVYEARQLRLMAEKAGVPTQMGIQVHSSAAYRRAVQMIQAGVIGKVSQVHAWSSKNWGYDGPAFKNEQPSPETLDWNLWLGTAEQRAFTPGVYHSGAWRKLVDFGTGTLGDMGVHIFDTPYAALALTFPNWVKTSCRTPTGVGHPEKNKVEYEFPGTAYTTKTLSWIWYDGSFAPPNAAELKLPEGIKLPGQASLFVGEGGTMLLPHVGEAQLYAEEKFRDYKRPEVKDENHYHQWVNACLGEGKTSADFTYGGMLTEALLLGVVANRFPDVKLDWNAEKMEFSNMPEANKLIRRKYRDGFQVENL